MRKFTEKQLAFMRDGGCVYATHDGSFLYFKMRWNREITSYYFHHRKKEWVWGSDEVKGEFAKGWKFISMEEMDRFLALLEVS